jgi:hypothetical protein
MPKALILIADGSEEIEFVTPYDGKLYYSKTRSSAIEPLFTYFMFRSSYSRGLRSHISRRVPQK